MSKQHPTPWQLNCWYDDEGWYALSQVRPILDSVGNAVMVTDCISSPPDKETVEEIVWAVNAYNRPLRVCDEIDDAGAAAKAVLSHFEEHGMMAPQAQYWVERVTEFLFAEAGKKKGGLW